MRWPVLIEAMVCFFHRLLRDVADPISYSCVAAYMPCVSRNYLDAWVLAAGMEVVGAGT
jgi:hypothetical protein